MSERKPTGTAPWVRTRRAGPAGFGAHWGPTDTPHLLDGRSGVFPWLSDALADLDAAGLRRARRTVTPLTGGRCLVDGRECWNFTTNDYLDLAGDPRLVEAAQAVLGVGGGVSSEADGPERGRLPGLPSGPDPATPTVGARASALVSGRTEWHERLEERIARFEGTEAAILFPTGYAANVGTIAALADTPQDVLFGDRLNHASLVDGCRLAAGRLRVYRHDRLDRLERELRKAGDARRRLIVTDGVFSMDGNAAPLRELCELAEEYGAELLVDEAHGTGVFGKHGRGLCEELGVEERVAVRVGTLSKAVGTLGGFVAGSRGLIDWLWNRARTQIYSTALPPAICAAAAVAFDVIEAEPERRAKLFRLASRLRGRLPGLPFGPDPATPPEGPIVPVIVGEAERTMAVAKRLEERGFLVAAIRPPTVPRGTARLRISLTCAFDDAVIDELAEAVTEALS